MITYVTGNIFESPAEALVNTVNTVGVMGKGIALQFKKSFPGNYNEYRRACKNGELSIGQLLISTDRNMDSGEKIIINFPTKTDWRKSSEYSYIEAGLDTLARELETRGIKSVAIPPLGAGNGGLNWPRVKSMIEDRLKDSSSDIFVYEPNKEIKEHLKTERVKLTHGRALLLFVFQDLVRNGSFVSEFAGEKICYFLQLFGAKKYFRLNYIPYFYGPYSGKVRFVLSALNGSYLMGYSDMDKNPFDPLLLIGDSYGDVISYINEYPDLKEIGEKTMKFLDGFYSDFSLELLSSVDYIVRTEKTFDVDTIFEKLNSWNDRKRSLFSEKAYVKLAVDHLIEYWPAIGT